MEERKTMPLMVSISGIRGVIGETLTPDVITRYAAAYVAYCQRRTEHPPTIIVGRDGRITGKPVTDTLCAALVLSGAHVINIGICPTPTVQLAVEQEHAQGGIAVTASHNPMQWNGLKFMASTGLFLDPAQNAEFWKIAQDPPTYQPWNAIGTERSDTSWLQRHIDAVLRLPLLRLESIRRRHFTAVLDCVNAAGGLIVPDLLRELGCDVVKMKCEVSGVFQHTPEPVPENLTDLAARVAASHADLGIAVDPDVDRLVLINERGEPYGEEYTIATAVDFVLQHRDRLASPPEPPRVVINLSTTRAVEEIAHRYGATVVRTPVGEIHVAAKMRDINAVIGGEGSGGVILPAVHLGRDAIVGIGLLLQHLAESGGTLSELKSSLPSYAIAKGKLQLRGPAPDDVLGAVRAHHGTTGTINTDDGLRIDYPEYWVHLRKSNTEPIIRIIAEAATLARAESVVTMFQKEIAGMMR
jgi:phosphomannomutase